MYKFNTGACSYNKNKNSTEFKAEECNHRNCMVICIGHVTLHEIAFSKWDLITTVL